MPTTDTDPEREVTIRPFAAVLQEQRAGVAHTELSERLAELVSRCHETGKKGSLTLKLTVTPQKDGATIMLGDDIKVAAPAHDVKPSLFFPDVDGNLLRTDPRQLDLGSLREVPGGKTGDLKEAKAS